jgi:hypothetical protein
VPNRRQNQESDDLNDEFVQYKDAKINVSLFPLSDLQEVAEQVVQTAPDGTPQQAVERHYYYGGGIGSHLGFLMLYSFLMPRPSAYYYAPSGAGGGRRVTLGQTRPPTPPPSYTPRPRPTQFSSARVGGTRGIGRTKPSGFGRTTVRTSGGKISSVRSGSFGRGGAATGG